MNTELLKLAEDLLPHTAPFPESVRSVVADTVLSGGPATRVEVDVAFGDISDWWDVYLKNAERQPLDKLYLALRYFMHAVQKVGWDVSLHPTDTIPIARDCFNTYIRTITK